MERDKQIENVGRLKNILIEAATAGFSPVMNEEYQRLRKELLMDTQLKTKLPRQMKFGPHMGGWGNLSEFRIDMQNGRDKWQERRVHINNLFKEITEYLTKEDPNVVLPGKPLLDIVQIHEEWTKAISRVDSDPDGALTTAKSLMETVCKHILDERDISYSPSDNLPNLYKKVTDTLELGPKDAHESLKKICGSCLTIIHSMAELRNLMGDSHGKNSTTPKPELRHAELAVNVAGATAIFLLRTHEKIAK
jgi:hypothetical protein